MTGNEPDGEWGQERRSFSSRTPINDNPEKVVYRRGFVTRHQVTGWRFVMRRLASGIALHDTRMLVDPLRTQSRSVLMGALILVTGLAGCFVFSLIRPNGQAGNNAVLADRSTAALYVRVGDELHPVLNLTSARLIVGKPVNPTTVKSTELDRFPRGNLIGIPGAPERMVQNTSHDANWTVCDAVTGAIGHGAHSTSVTVVAGPPDSNGARAGALRSGQAVLVDSPLRGKQRHLAAVGRKAQPDRPFRSRGDQRPGPRRARAATRRAGIVQRDPRGAAADSAGHPECRCRAELLGARADWRGGGVLRPGHKSAADNARYYAVLPDGLQPISAGARRDPAQHQFLWAAAAAAAWCRRGRQAPGVADAGHRAVPGSADQPRRRGP